MQPTSVLTDRYANSRIGVNLAETKLNVANVNDAGFARKLSPP
jgi:hypothetical protein